MTSRLRIIVTGLVALHPVGGVAWDYLQYVIGLARLGHDVYYHEDTWSWPYDPERERSVDVPDYSVRFLERFFARHAPELAERWHYLHLHEQSFGLSRSRFEEVARHADLFLNVSGACMIPDALSPHCVKVFLDTDPGYNQIVMSERFDWSENVERWCASVREHERHFTYAENIGRPGCRVPTLGLSWTPTRMPVVLDCWSDLEAVAPAADAPWTTVLTWGSFAGPLVYDGAEYQSKAAEFEKLLDLPRRVDLRLKIAVGGLQPPWERLRKAGWDAVDGPRQTRTPESYRSFVAASRGEISAAKHVYVALRTGWFSCRSACYLAAGRPVVVQDTGLDGIIPSGEGILLFASEDEAVDALGAVESDYARHRRAARSLAEEHFDSDRVLARLLEDAFDG